MTNFSLLPIETWSLQCLHSIYIPAVPPVVLNNLRWRDLPVSALMTSICLAPSIPWSVFFSLWWFHRWALLCSEPKADPKSIFFSFRLFITVASGTAVSEISFNCQKKYLNCNEIWYYQKRVWKSASPQSSKSHRVNCLKRWLQKTLYRHMQLL